MDLAHNAEILLEILNRIMQRIMSMHYVHAHAPHAALPQTCRL